MMTVTPETNWPAFAAAVIEANRSGEPLTFGDRDLAMATFAKLWLDERAAVTRLLSIVQEADRVHMAEIARLDAALGEARAKLATWEAIAERDQGKPINDGGPCVHSRPDWRMCPHCIGINVAKEQL